MDDIFLQLSKLTMVPDDASGKSADGDNAQGTGSDGNPAAAPKPTAEQLYGNGALATDNEAMFVYDNLVIPDLTPKKSTSGRKRILVIDDDFATLDLMKIYLQRTYDYYSFDNPKDAIFWLNTNVPDLIFIDCYLTIINSKRVVEIIRSYKEIAKVPIFYLSEPAEMGAVSGKLPEGVLGVISRPVGRGDLQGVLNYAFRNDLDSM